MNTSLDPDEDALALMKTGDPDGLSVLMDRHLTAIKSVAWHILGDDMAAEDVAQDTFLKAWVKASDWQSGSAKYKTWLVRVATNDCLSRLRKRKEVLSDKLPEPEDETPLVDNVMIADERAAAVQKVLRSLPERQRVAITLSHFQGLSQIEGASILEVSEAAYESLLARARRSLRQKLTPVLEAF